jgi:predicted naringenin-chalcone synthase
MKTRQRKTPAAPFIAALGTAVPPPAREQQAVAEFMIRAHGLDEREARRLRRLYRLTRIETRHSCLADYGLPWTEFTFFPRHPALTPPPGTAERMLVYRREAPALAAAACRDLFTRSTFAPADVEHLIVVSCTGAYAPGLDLDLARALELRPDVGRAQLAFQGCHAGLTALRLAEAHARARPETAVLVVCVELCTLHFQLEPTEENLLANALFADGAAAALVTGAARPPAGRALRLLATASRLAPEGCELMTWTIGDRGFELRLASSVPRVVEAGMREGVAEALGLPAGALREQRFWAAHPGGTAILDAVERAYSLDGGALAASREVLRRFGNMSSPTVFFVLRELLSGGANGNGSLPSGAPGLALAFGPGLTIEAARLEVTEDPA